VPISGRFAHLDQEHPTRYAKGSNDSYTGQPLGGHSREVGNFEQSAAWATQD